MLLLDSLPREGTETVGREHGIRQPRIVDCWTLCPERGRKLALIVLFSRGIDTIVGLFAPRGDGNTYQPSAINRKQRRIVGLFAPRGDGNFPHRSHLYILIRPIVGLFTPRGDGNRLAIGHKGVGRERVVGLFTSKRSRISTAAPSRNFYSTSDSCRTTVRRRPRGSCRGAPRIRGDDPR